MKSEIETAAGLRAACPIDNRDHDWWTQHVDENIADWCSRALAALEARERECAEGSSDRSTLGVVMAQLAAARGEVERLRARHNPEVCVDTMEYSDQLKADNDHLRLRLSEVEAEAVTFKTGWQAAENEVDRLRADAEHARVVIADYKTEVERLKRCL